MTLEERGAKAQQILAETNKQLQECGYALHASLIPEMPSDSFLLVKPQVQLRPIPDWVEPVALTKALK